MFLCLYCLSYKPAPQPIAPHPLNLIGISCLPYMTLESPLFLSSTMLYVAKCSMLIKCNNHSFCFPHEVTSFWKVVVNSAWYFSSQWKTDRWMNQWRNEYETVSEPFQDLWRLWLRKQCIRHGNKYKRCQRRWEGMFVVLQARLRKPRD